MTSVESDWFAEERLSKPSTSWRVKYIFIILAIQLSFWVLIGYSEEILRTYYQNWGTHIGIIPAFVAEECFDFCLIMGAIYWVICVRYKASLRNIGLISHDFVADFFLGVLAGGILWSIVGLIDDLIQSIFGEGLFVQPLLQYIKQASTGYEYLLLFCAGALLTAISEECFTTGLVYNTFKKKYTKRTAIFLTSGLFALEHINPVWFPTAFLFSLCLIFLYEYSGSLIAPISAHATANACALWVAHYSG